MNGSVFSGPSDRRLHDFRAIGRGIGRCFFFSLSRDCGRNAKSHECHSEPQAKNLTMPASCKSEILRLTPQDDIATQSPSGEGTVRSLCVFCNSFVEEGHPMAETRQQPADLR